MTLQAGYFDSMYAASPDPWGLQSRWYEARKYAISVAMLPQRRYARAFEPGCSIGVLTELLLHDGLHRLGLDAVALQRRADPGGGDVLLRQQIVGAVRLGQTGTAKRRPVMALMVFESDAVSAVAE